MLFKRLILENYGLYSGYNEFILSSNAINSKEKSIVLFGGKNGSGKTTFLEALKLILYGRRFSNTRLTKSEYETFLKNKIHIGSNSTLRANSSKVALEFEYANLGQLSTYYVERSWQVRVESNSLDESLQILVNDNPLENVTEEFWRGFIEEILPERIAQLFFFDGEKIQDIAREDTGNLALANSIKSLLGLDIVEKLKADLTIYKNKELIGQSTRNDKIQWDLIEKDIRLLKINIELILTEKLPQTRTSIEGKYAEIRQRENQLHSEGNLFATRRDSLKQEQNSLSEKIAIIETEIRSEAEKSFPFSLSSTISKLLLNQIKIEKRIEKHSVIKNEMSDLQNSILEEIRNIQHIDSVTLEQIKSTVTKHTNKRIDQNKELESEIKFLELSDSAAKHFHQIINHEAIDSKLKIKKLSDELTLAIDKLRKTTIEIDKIPDDEQIKPIFEELSILNQELGVLKQEEERYLKDINKLKDDLKIKQKDLNKLIEKQSSLNRLDLVDKVQSILDEYLQELTASKTDLLQKSVAEAFNSLTRKTNFIDKVEIDPTTFAVTLYKPGNEIIPKSLLSSGEKQLYAIAILWGLARTSGRPLPVIIDTPLGRLDTDHRMNLITNYFPDASHQVILLSTDTEVDKELFVQLSPHVSHCYHLEFNPESKNTTVTPEYFWEGSDSCLN